MHVLDSPRSYIFIISRMLMNTGTERWLYGRLHGYYLGQLISKNQRTKSFKNLDAESHVRILLLCIFNVQVFWIAGVIIRFGLWEC